eukprot:scaffold159697_cov56-Cyclotella_meneghiniana.AAC.8
MASTTSQGFNARMEPALSVGGGVYRLTNIKVDKSYAVEVKAPAGYYLTSGVCNDNERGWRCEYTGRNTDGTRNLRSNEIVYDSQEEEEYKFRNLQADHSKNSGKKEFAMGISTGRSTECITVDREGVPDGMLNFGVMRIGDSKAEDTDVALVLDFEDAIATGRRGLKEMIADAVELPRSEGDAPTVRRYLLGETDKKAIGSVTAEVLASRLDKRLAENQIVLDQVEPKDVIVSDDSAQASKEVAVAMNIKGHYSPPPELDFEYIVNDSINSDTDMIRRELKNYNENCRDQTAQVNTGASISDFDEVHSLKGTQSSKGQSGKVYRTVCAEGETLPTMFETSLKEISATKVNEIAFAPIIYMEQGLLSPWATGPTAAVAGMIVLLMGLFVFRRAFGPRKVDKYRQLQKTGMVDVGDERRFGEMGGDIDDGSVDSAFYSSDDEDGTEYDDDAQKNKEKKMRAKLRAEAEKAKSNGASSKKLFSKKTAKGAKKAVSGSADDTDSVPSSSSDEKKAYRKKGDVDEKKAYKKSMKAVPGADFSDLESSSGKSKNDSKGKSDLRASKKVKSDLRASKKVKSELSASTKEKSDLRKSTRGRDRTEGGDNAKVDAELKKMNSIV